MSRSGYIDSDEIHPLVMGRYIAASNKATKGKRGQKALKGILAALEAMPEKRLIAESLQTADGEFCTLGAYGAVTGIKMDDLDPEDWEAVAKRFNIAASLVRDIVYENDEGVPQKMSMQVTIEGPMRSGYPNWEKHDRWVFVDIPEVGERRWRHMRDFVKSRIIETPTETQK